MKFDMTARALVLGKKDCTTCRYGAGERGQYTGKKTCDKCNGTGAGPRGGRHSCRACSGFGTQPDFDNPIACPVCGGDWQDAMDETFTDEAPVGAVLSMPIVVARLDRNNTFNENYIGLGCLWSATDYGTAAETSDEDLILKIRHELETQRTQATKIVRPYERGQTVALLHDTLVIAVTRNGYSVRAMSEGAGNE